MIQQTNFCEFCSIFLSVLPKKNTYFNLSFYSRLVIINYLKYDGSVTGWKTNKISIIPDSLVKLRKRLEKILPQLNFGTLKVYLLIEHTKSLDYPLCVSPHPPKRDKIYPPIVFLGNSLTIELSTKKLRTKIKDRKIYYSILW